jgi:hypothetical protein
MENHTSDLEIQAAWRTGPVYNLYRRMPRDLTWTALTLGVDPLTHPRLRK